MERKDLGGHRGAVGGGPVHVSVSGIADGDEGVGDGFSQQEIDSAITSLSGDDDNAVKEEHSWLDDVLKSVAIETTSTTLESKEFQRSFVYSTVPKSGKSRGTSTAV